MNYPEPMSWNRAEARKGKFNGTFILGVMTTGIYCLPSCAARPPKPQNVRLFTTEAWLREFQLALSARGSARSPSTSPSVRQRQRRRSDDRREREITAAETRLAKAGFAS